jgi:hypothetical protein
MGLGGGRLCRSCCEGGPCCEGDPPSRCLTVTIQGITGIDCGCNRCEELNLAADVCGGPCGWEGFICDDSQPYKICGRHGRIAVAIAKSEGTWVVVGSLDDIIWRHDFGDKRPKCSDINGLVLHYHSGGGDGETRCDAENSTMSIAFAGDECSCGHECVSLPETCGFCFGDNPTVMRVTVSGLVDDNTRGTPPWVWGNVCAPEPALNNWCYDLGCCPGLAQANGNFVCDRDSAFGGCVWSYSAEPIHGPSCNGACEFTGITVSLYQDVGGEIHVRATLHFTDWNPAPRYMTFGKKLTIECGGQTVQCSDTWDLTLVATDYLDPSLTENPTVSVTPGF